MKQTCFAALAALLLSVSPAVAANTLTDETLTPVVAEAVAPAPVLAVAAREAGCRLRDLGRDDRGCAAEDDRRASVRLQWMKLAPTRAPPPRLLRPPAGPAVCPL